MLKCYHFLVALLASVFLQKFCSAALPQEIQQVARPWFPHYDADDLKCKFLLDPKGKKFDISKSKKILNWFPTAFTPKAKQEGERSRQLLLGKSPKPSDSQPGLFNYGDKSPSDYFKNPKVLKKLRMTYSMKIFLEKYPIIESALDRNKWLSEAFYHLLTELIDDDDKLFAHEVQLNSWLHVFGHIAYSDLEAGQVEPRITMIYGLYTVALYSEAANHAEAMKFAMGLAESIKQDVRELIMKENVRLKDVWGKYLFLDTRRRREIPPKLDDKWLQESRKALPPSLANQLPTTEEKSELKSIQIKNMLAPVFDPKRRASAYSRVVEAFKYNHWCLHNLQYAVKPEYSLLDHEMLLFCWSRQDFDSETLTGEHGQTSRD